MFDDTKIVEIIPEYCLDCGIELYQPMPGIVGGAWLRTDGNKEEMKVVPGGIVYGKELGFVCSDCSIFGKKEREREARK